MQLLVSGEGPTDMGSMVPGDDGWEFRPGPMAYVIDKLIENSLDYSVIEFEAIVFISETDLAALEPTRQKRKITLPGKTQPKETGYYQVNAQRLAEEARRRGDAEARDTIPVLFRDADGTQSAGRGMWQDKWDSMLRRFEAAGCEVGVPMLPKPKSEAWLLCACKENPYQDCAALENESGNDNALNPLKSQLCDALNGEASGKSLCKAVETMRIDPTQIDMPSFNCFRHRLEMAIGQIGNGV